MKISQNPRTIRKILFEFDKNIDNLDEIIKYIETQQSQEDTFNKSKKSTLPPTYQERLIQFRDFFEIQNQKENEDSKTITENIQRRITSLTTYAVKQELQNNIDHIQNSGIPVPEEFQNRKEEISSQATDFCQSLQELLTNLITNNKISIEDIENIKSKRKTITELHVQAKNFNKELTLYADSHKTQTKRDLSKKQRKKLNEEYYIDLIDKNGKRSLANGEPTIKKFLSKNNRKQIRDKIQKAREELLKTKSPLKRKELKKRINDLKGDLDPRTKIYDHFAQEILDSENPELLLMKLEVLKRNQFISNTDAENIRQNVQKKWRNLSPINLAKKGVIKGISFPFKRVHRALKTVSNDPNSKFHKIGKTYVRKGKQSENIKIGAKLLIDNITDKISNTINTVTSSVKEFTSTKITKPFLNTRVGKFSKGLVGGLNTTRKGIGQIVGGGLKTAPGAAIAAGTLAATSGGAILPAMAVGGLAGVGIGAFQKIGMDILNQAPTQFRNSPIYKTAFKFGGKNALRSLNDIRIKNGYQLNSFHNTLKEGEAILDRAKQGKLFTRFATVLKSLDKIVNFGGIGSVIGAAAGGPAGALIGFGLGAASGVGSQFIGDSVSNHITKLVVKDVSYDLLAKLPLQHLDGMIQGNKWLSSQVKLQLEARGAFGKDGFLNNQEQLKLNPIEKQIYSSQNILSAGFNIFNAASYIWSYAPAFNMMLNGGMRSLFKILRQLMRSSSLGAKLLIRGPITGGSALLGASLLSGFGIPGIIVGALGGGTLGYMASGRIMNAITSRIGGAALGASRLSQLSTAAIRAINISGIAGSIGGTAIGTILATALGLPTGLAFAIGGAIGGVIGFSIGTAIAGSTTVASLGSASVLAPAIITTTTTIFTSIGNIIGGLFDKIFGLSMPNIPNPLSLFMGFWNFQKIFTAKLNSLTDYAKIATYTISAVSFLAILGDLMNVNNGSQAQCEGDNCSQALYMQQIQPNYIFAAETNLNNENLELILNPYTESKYFIKNIVSKKIVNKNLLLLKVDNFYFTINNPGKFIIDNKSQKLIGKGKDISIKAYSLSDSNSHLDINSDTAQYSNTYKNPQAKVAGIQNFKQENFCHIQAELCQNK